MNDNEPQGMMPEEPHFRVDAAAHNAGVAANTLPNIKTTRLMLEIDGKRYGLLLALPYEFSTEDGPTRASVVMHGVRLSQIAYETFVKHFEAVVGPMEIYAPAETEGE